MVILLCSHSYESAALGDVLLHCVVDALLGALGLPDIGQLFPDNDPKWKGASSDIFMKEAVQLPIHIHMPHLVSGTSDEGARIHSR